MIRSIRTAKLSLALVVATLSGVLGCATQDASSELDEVALSATTSAIKVSAGTRFVVPKGLAVVSDGLVLISTVSSDPTTGGEQGKSCPFEGARKTQTGDTACGYDNNKNWVCCSGTCEYTCNINQFTNAQYWNTESCSVIESTCGIRSGGPGGGGFDIFQTQGAN